MDTVADTSNSGKDENVVQKVLEVFLVIFEVITLLVKINIAIAQRIYEIIVPPAEKNVTNEVVLITGTGHGIGRELALQYGALGAKVVCVDINEANNNKTVQELKKNNYVAHGYKCDISKRDDVLALAAKVQKEVGNVTILVNNAGIMPTKKFLDHTVEDYRKLFDINVFAHFWTIEAFIPKMLEHNYGHIVALSSMAGICGFPHVVPYCASKFAVRGLMEGLHEEYRQTGKNLHFTSILPYMVDTGLCKKPKIRFEKFMKMLDPAEVARQIISAQRRNIPEVSVPNYMLYMNYLVRTLPLACAMHIIDFFQTGLDPAEDY